MLLNSQAYTDSEYMLDIPDQFIAMRGIFHFCLMGTKPFKAFNFNLSIQNSKQADVVQNMIENLLQAFLMKGFSYLSVLEGGFERCHDFAGHFKIDLESHDKLLCLGCNPLGVKNSKTSKRNSLQNFFFRKNSEKCFEKDFSKIKKESKLFVFSCKK